MRTFSGESDASPPAGSYLTLLCEPIPHPSSVEFPLDCSTFLTRHSMDLHFTHCEGRVTELLGYIPDDLIGRSAYEFHHALDSEHVTKSLNILLSKGQVCTSHYRFLAKSGGFVWAETQATVIYNSKTSQPEAVVCLNFILSGVEQADVVFSAHQTPFPETKKEPECEEEEVTVEISSRLFFKLKDSPEELLQLAPASGEEVVPLTEEKELSCFGPPSSGCVPESPRELCTPELRELLSPIFDGSSGEPSPPPSLSEEPMAEDMVKKLFAAKPEDTSQEKSHTMDVENMDLDMLAPYISMDDDFQLTFLNPFPESQLSSPDPTTGVNRKRAMSFDEETSSHLTMPNKRKRDACDEERLLLSHALLASLVEADEAELEPRPGHSQLLTDRDPILGDTTALMRTFMSRPSDPIGLKERPLS